MNKQPLELYCSDGPEGLCDLFVPHLDQAAVALDLVVDFSKIGLILDDLSGCSDPWFQFESVPKQDSGLCLEVYLPAELFCRIENGDSGVFPGKQIWETGEAPRQDLIMDLERFRPEFCLQYLHHHLLTARDLGRRELVPGRVPANVAEFYQACWAVTVDGRLERWGLPGFAMPERRRHFSRLFSQAGVLMPNHWAIFQALWEGGICGQGSVLDAVGALPRL